MNELNLFKGKYFNKLNEHTFTPFKFELASFYHNKTGAPPSNGLLLYWEHQSEVQTQKPQSLLNSYILKEFACYFNKISALPECCSCQNIQDTWIKISSTDRHLKRDQKYAELSSIAQCTLFYSLG